LTGRNDLDRRTFLGLMGAGGVSTLLSCGLPGRRAERKRPNVLFLVVDDLRPQLGCYGHKEIRSPNLDALARRGTLFERAYCQVPVCGPSRLTVLTGIRVSPAVWNSRGMKASFVSMPAWFKSHGYYALSLGKVFHYKMDRAGDWSEPPWRSKNIYGKVKGVAAKGNWAEYNKNRLWHNPESGKYINPRTGRGPYCEWAEAPDDVYEDGMLAERAVKTLEMLARRKEPFFLACGFWRPHLPLNCPKRYWDLYDPKKIRIADNRYRPKGAPPQLRGSREIDSYARVKGRKKTIPFHVQTRHAYYACVSFVDAQVGKVLGALRRLGLEENTVVVLWGDHGWHLGEHNFWGKHNTLENALRAPLLLAGPGVPAGLRTDALVELVDIYPTLCDLAGLPLPGHLEGTSMVPLLRNPERPWKRAVFAKWVNGAGTVGTKRYFYTQWIRKDGKRAAEMLYDHRVDPEENVNVAGDPKYAKVVARLRRFLAEGWRGAAPGKVR